jgi:hypothetical protein
LDGARKAKAFEGSGEGTKSVRRFDGSAVRKFTKSQRAAGRGQQTTDESVREVEGSRVRRRGRCSKSEGTLLEKFDFSVA